MTKTIDNLQFSANWNNKLACKYFTSVRLHNPNKFQVGKELLLQYPGRTMPCEFFVKVVSIKTFYLHEVNEFVAYLDAGYSPNELKQYMTEMYPDVDFHRKKIDLLLLTQVYGPVPDISEIDRTDFLEALKDNSNEE